jgi:hypothetical protein
MNITLSDLGKAAYDAYCAAREWKSFAGNPLPQFDRQTEPLQAAWILAAQAARAVPYGETFVYKSESVGGNIHAATSYLNHVAHEKRIEVVHMESDGHNSIVVWKEAA